MSTATQKITVKCDSCKNEKNPKVMYNMYLKGKKKKVCQSCLDNRIKIVGA